MSRNRATLRAPEEAVRDGARMINEREELIEIEDLTLGPLGIGRLDGKAVMVANSAPGDVLQVNITEEHRDYLLARLNSVLKSGPARRAAPCIYLPRCGGCDWQQIDYPQQLALKARLIAAELKRALGVDLDPAELIVPAPAEFGYRSRVRLKVSRNGALGFFETASNRLVEVDRCLIAGDDLSFAPGRRLALALRGRCDEIEIVKAGGRQVLVANLRGRVQASDTAKAGEALAGDGIVAGIVLRGGGDRVGIGYVSATVELEPGMILRAAADAFSQVNHECNRTLIDAVMGAAAIAPGMKVLDLFCGAGNFSLPAAKRGAQVLGVDADPIAISAAQRNAAELGLEQARFAALQAQEMAPFLVRAGHRPQVIILDPPRSGARDLMKMIGALGAARVVYVSCNVATLARDLRILTGDGYAIASVKAFDFFPNTHHCEVLALLT
jgi:23S rRNA (uracil1939-C5)-methyltransferase